MVIVKLCFDKIWTIIISCLYVSKIGVSILMDYVLGFRNEHHLLCSGHGFNLEVTVYFCSRHKLPP